MANAAAGMKGRGKRFVEEKTTTEADVGPGAYNHHVLVSGHKATLSGRAAEQVDRGGSSVFASDSVRELSMA